MIMAKIYVASRSEYWWFWLIYLLILIGLPLIAFLADMDYGIGATALMLAWAIGSLGFKMIPDTHSMSMTSKY